MSTVLLIIHILIALALIAVVLLVPRFYKRLRGSA